MKKISRIITLITLCSLPCASHAVAGKYAALLRSTPKTALSDMWYNIKNKRSAVYQFQHKAIKEYDATMIKEVTITHGLGNVVVENWDNNRINITSRMQANNIDVFNRTRLHTATTDTTATITTEYCGKVPKGTPTIKVGKCSRINWRTVQSTDKSATVDLFIKLPKKSYVTASALNGHMRINHIQGDVHATTIAGSITADNCHTVDARSTYGTVTINGHTAHAIELEKN